MSERYCNEHRFSWPEMEGYDFCPYCEIDRLKKALRVGNAELKQKLDNGLIHTCNQCGAELSVSVAKDGSGKSIGTTQLLKENTDLKRQVEELSHSKETGYSPFELGKQNGRRLERKRCAEIAIERQGTVSMFGSSKECRAYNQACVDIASAIEENKDGAAKNPDT